MKRIYNIFILFFGLFIVYLTFPYILSYLSTRNINTINCIEWHKNNTGFCDDFSNFEFDIFVFSIVLILIPIAFTIMMMYFIHPFSNKSK